jgi:hypothetical protein
MPSILEYPLTIYRPSSEIRPTIRLERNGDMGASTAAQKSHSTNSTSYFAESALSQEVRGCMVERGEREEKGRRVEKGRRKRTREGREREMEENERRNRTREEDVRTV